MSRQVTYNVDNVNFSVAGHRVRDFGEGTAITIEPNEDRTILKVGAMGEYIASVSNDKSVTITFNLLQNSLSLPVLEELLEREEAFPGTLVDMNDGITKSAQHCWVQSLGNYERGTEAEDVEVTLVAGRWE